MQVIKTKSHGLITFLKTWADGNIHIGLTSTGEYRHIGGPVVVSRSDLDIIGDMDIRDSAYTWFDTRGTELEAEKIMAAASVPKNDYMEPDTTDTEAAAMLEKIKQKKSAKRDYPCKTCGRMFGSPIALYNHAKTHAAEMAEDAAVNTESIDE